MRMRMGRHECIRARCECICARCEYIRARCECIRARCECICARCECIRARCECICARCECICARCECICALRIFAGLSFHRTSQYVDVMANLKSLKAEFFRFPAYAARFWMPLGDFRAAVVKKKLKIILKNVRCLGQFDVAVVAPSYRWIVTALYVPHFKRETTL